MNCGCCDDTTLGCDQPVGHHNPDHIEMREEYGPGIGERHYYYVTWREISKEKYDAWKIRNSEKLTGGGNLTDSTEVKIPPSAVNSGPSATTIT